ncbi:hypothetical protein A2690_04535 [Candidatus Roizmanbacteria bacterium RIFCSPHIGHO2_01_FULL_39_12b]|uniref:AbiEi antitoxin C-terminal domain-containing protein n=1 Tax=Candidatus Roizmanbacteria bacterium RIFCSPHIGHO2_01_FULL_39_12b TaxID=1802030 RepID=A0A1F7GAC9_9BACT|nr:MAG: hypothetical protein A2690_04535 [Candidatus Roizmanbacteria bacterium RIFCSPHIGHO2_01_FULL_39_12b]
MKPIAIREILLKNNRQVFTTQEFERLFQIKGHRAKYFLEQQTKQDLFIRLKRGLYALKTDLISEEEIANKLYVPSYISFEYALAFHSVIPEMVYTITCATTKPTRLFNANNREFAYFTIKKSAYTGYIMKKNGSRQILVATPEKAFVDYLYYVSLGRKSPNDRFQTKKLDKNMTLQYARLFQREKLIKLVKSLC